MKREKRSLLFLLIAVSLLGLTYVRNRNSIQNGLRSLIEERKIRSEADKIFQARLKKVQAIVGRSKEDHAKELWKDLKIQFGVSNESVTYLDQIAFYIETQVPIHPDFQVASLSLRPIDPIFYKEDSISIVSAGRVFYEDSMITSVVVEFHGPESKKIQKDVLKWIGSWSTIPSINDRSIGMSSVTISDATEQNGKIKPTPIAPQIKELLSNLRTQFANQTQINELKQSLATRFAKILKSPVDSDGFGSDYFKKYVKNMKITAVYEKSHFREWHYSFSVSRGMAFDSFFCVYRRIDRLTDCSVSTAL